MRLIAPTILLATLLLPLASRAGDAPTPTFACHVAISRGDELYECLDISVPNGNVEAIDRARAHCKQVTDSINGEDGPKQTPRLTAASNSIDPCDVSEYLTKCAYKPKETAASVTIHYYTVDHALGVKQECAKDKGKWTENPAYKDYLHPPRVSAEQLHQEWRTNQAKAMQQRGKKVMALFGKLLKVTVDDDEEVSVMLNVTGFQRLVVVVGVSAEKAAEFKPNTTVSFDRCIITGRTQMWDNPVVTCE